VRQSAVARTAAGVAASGLLPARRHEALEFLEPVLDKGGKVDLIINTPLGHKSRYDEGAIRRAASKYTIPPLPRFPEALR